MTDLRTHAAADPEPPELEYPRPPAVGAVLAAGGVAGAGVIAVAALAVVAWLGTDGGTASGAVRVGLRVWLLAHGTPVAFDGLRFGLPPLGLTVGILALWTAAAAWIARTCAVRRGRDVLVATGTLTAVYAAAAVLFAVLARADQAGPALLNVALVAAAVAAVGGGAGVVVRSGFAGRLWARLPDEAQAAGFGAVAGVGALLSGGALLVAAGLVTHFQRVVDLTDGLAPGLVGGILLTLVGVAYVPNAVVYAATFALGPGFAVGEATIVAPTGVELGQLPSFPLLGALPTETVDGWIFLVLVVPFFAGALSGVVAVRRRPVGSYDLAALRGALAGAGGGLLFAVIALVSAGSGGPARLADVGPSAREVALVAVTSLALSGAAAGLLATVWGAGRARRAGPASAAGVAAPADADGSPPTSPG